MMSGENCSMYIDIVTGSDWLCYVVNNHVPLSRLYSKCIYRAFGNRLEVLSGVTKMTKTERYNVKVCN